MSAIRNCFVSSGNDDHTRVPSHFLTFFQYCSMGFSSGLYGGSLNSLICFILMKFITSFVRCHVALSTMMQSFLWCLFNRVMNARYFLPLIFGLSFVIVFPIPNAPKTQVF